MTLTQLSVVMIAKFFISNFYSITSPEHKVLELSFCDCAVFVVCHQSSNFTLCIPNPFLHIYSFKHMKKSCRKTLWKKVKLLKMSNFTFFHNVFLAICILKSFNSHMSVVICSFLNLGQSQNSVLGIGLIKELQFVPGTYGNLSECLS